MRISRSRIETNNIKRLNYSGQVMIRPFTLKSNLEQPILIFLIFNLVKAAASILPKYIQQSWPLKEFTQTKFKISQNTGYFRVCLKLYWLTFLKKIIRFLKPPKAHLSNGNVRFLTNFKGTRSASNFILISKNRFFDL